MKNIQDFMRYQLDNNMLQFELLMPDRFLDYLKKRGIYISLQELEYYDKLELLRPVLRIRRLENEDKESPNKYAMLVTDSYSVKRYYDGGMVDFPKENDFVAWKEYRLGRENNVELFYHPYQLLLITRIRELAIINMRLDFFETQDLAQKLNKHKEIKLDRIKCFKENLEHYNSQIGLLILLQGPYGSLFRFDFFDKDNKESIYEKWVIWRNNEFNPSDILEICKLSINDVNKFFDWMCTSAVSIDPLSHWYDLMQLIKKELRNRLQGSALLAQDYYEFARMLKDFLSDLKNEDVKYTNELMDNTSGKWKEFTYGLTLPIEYDNTLHQKGIRDRFMIYRPNTVFLVYEGDTEDVVIRSIFQTQAINEKREGIVLFSAGGKGKIKKNLNLLARQLKEDNIDLFVILDGEPDCQGIIDRLIENGLLQADMYKIWQNDFESDNFGVDLVIKKINEIFNEHNLNYTLSISEVHNNIGNKMLMTAISDIFFQKYKVKFDDVVSKKVLGEKLISQRIEKMKLDKEWKSESPLEDVILKLFKKYPRVMG